jgi:hypothetical protein
MEKSTGNRSGGARFGLCPEWQLPPHWQPPRNGCFLSSLIFFMAPRQKARHVMEVRCNARWISKFNASRIRHALLVLKINSKPVAVPTEEVEY